MEQTNAPEAPAAAPPGTCQWEGCTRPAAPKTGTRGPDPIYCGAPDPDRPAGSKNPAHNAQNRWRRKTGGADAGDEGRVDHAPVTTATATTLATSSEIARLAATLGATVDQLTAAAAVLSDADAAQAQIEAAVSEAAEEATKARGEASREKSQRIAAERLSTEATAAAAEMAAEVDGLTERLAAAEAERDEAAQAARTQAEAHEQALAAARAAAEEALAEATARTAAETQRAVEAEAALAAAQSELAQVTGERDTARTDAADLAEQLTAAQTDVQALQGERDEQARALAGARSELEREATRAETAEARVTELETANRDLDHRVIAAESVVEQLNARLAAAVQTQGFIESARAQLEQARDRLLEDLRKKDHELASSAGEASKNRKAADTAWAKLSVALGMLTTEQRAEVEAVKGRWETES